MTWKFFSALLLRANQLLSSKNSTVSSANPKISPSQLMENKLFIYMLRSLGPKTDPWETPYSKISSLLNTFSTIVIWVSPVKWVSKCCRALFLMPISFNDCKRSVCLTVSNAFYKSRKIQRHGFSLFRDPIILFVTAKIASCVEVFFRKPNWLSDNILYLSKYVVNRLLIILSNIFDNWVMREMVYIIIHRRSVLV